MLRPGPLLPVGLGPAVSPLSPWEPAGCGCPRRTEPTPWHPAAEPKFRAWWHSGTSKGGLQQGGPLWHPSAPRALAPRGRCPCPGDPSSPALLGACGCPFRVCPPFLLPSKGVGDGGGGSGAGVLGGPSLCSSPPAAAVTRRAAGTATRRPRTPSSSTGTDGAAPGGPRGATGQGAPVLGGRGGRM